MIVGYLLQISEQLADGDESMAPLRDKVTDLVAELDRGTLDRILRIGGDALRRRQIVRKAFKGLGANAALKILETAAGTAGQEISLLMVRMLTKLSFHAEVGAVSLRPRAARVVRESVDELLDGWDQEDPNPEGYVRILDELSRASPYLQPARAAMESETAALSVIQMAIEVDSYGEMVDRALDDILAEGGLAQVAPLVKGADPNQVARKIRLRIGSPAQIDALTDFEQVSPKSMELLVELVGPEKAVTPLLRLISESQSRALRRTVFDQLVKLGPYIGRSVRPFLEDPRWYVVRNMLELVAALAERPRGFTALRYVSHPDPRVRRAALPLALTESESQARALTLALREEDERMVRMALLHLREEPSRALVPLVIDHCLRDEDQPPSLRALAVRVLESSDDPLVREALVAVATGGRTFLGKPRLATTDGPEGELTKIALATLLRRWHGDDQIAPLMKAMEKSKDPVVRRVLATRGRDASASTASGEDDADGVPSWRANP